MNGMFRYLLICLMLFTGSAHTAEDDFDAVKKAAEQGYANAQNQLGFMYSVSDGVPEDKIQAYAWISLVAAQGVEKAKNAKEELTGEMARARHGYAGQSVPPGLVIESFWSMLKRAHKGAFHKLRPKHLQRYVNEFAGRLNIRELDTDVQMMKVAHGMVGRSCPMKT